MLGILCMSQARTTHKDLVKCVVESPKTKQNWTTMS